LNEHCLVAKHVGCELVEDEFKKLICLAGEDEKFFQLFLMFGYLLPQGLLLNALRNILFD
jgi:hypothetical protein